MNPPMEIEHMAFPQNPALPIKSFSLEVRHPNVSEEYFHYHFREIHGPIVLDNPRQVQYVQWRGGAGALFPFARSAYSGHAECWHPDEASIKVLEQDSARIAAGVDAADYVDKSKRAFALTIEDVIHGRDVTPGGASHVAGRLLVRQHYRANSEEFARWWNDVLPELVMAHVPGLVRYAQCLGFADAHAKSPSFAGFAEFTWEDPRQVLLESGVSLEALAAHLGDAPLSIVDTVSSIGTEVLQRWPGHVETRRSPERDRATGVGIRRRAEYLP
jgi:hypothetical protein